MKSSHGESACFCGSLWSDELAITHRITLIYHNNFLHRNYTGKRSWNRALKPALNAHELINIGVVNKFGDLCWWLNQYVFIFLHKINNENYLLMKKNENSPNLKIPQILTYQLELFHRVWKKICIHQSLVTLEGCLLCNMLLRQKQRRSHGRASRRIWIRFSVQYGIRMPGGVGCKQWNV